jgi:hypothetical protein
LKKQAERRDNKKHKNKRGGWYIYIHKKNRKEERGIHNDPDSIVGYWVLHKKNEWFFVIFFVGWIDGGGVGEAF